MERATGQQRRTDRLGEGGRVVDELSRILSADRVIAEGPVKREALSDGTANRGISGSADALAEPETTEEVAAVLAYCYENDLAIVTRGGGTGLAGGAVPRGGVVLSLERLNRVRSIDPGLWRMEVEAGVTTATVHRVALENGLLLPSRSRRRASSRRSAATSPPTPADRMPSATG